MTGDQTSTLQLEAEGRPGASGVLAAGDMPLAGGPAPISTLAPGVATAPSVDLAPEVVTALPPGVGVDVSYEPTPAMLSDAQLGDPSLGLVQPVGKPLRLHVRAEDTASGADITLDDSVASQVVPLRLPVVGPAVHADGEFTWLAEVRQNGQFLGYRRLATTYDGSANTLQTAMTLGELNDTLLLPAVLVPTFARATDVGVHVWSSPQADATDFGVLTDASAQLDVVGPNVAGRLYVYDPTTATYGWIDADSLAPVELLLTP